MSQPTGKRNTLYDQVLEHSRREIDEASAKIDELKRSLALLEARVEASKSVYEAVAARLNLEDEGNLPESAYADEPASVTQAAYPEAPPRLEEPEAEDSSSPVDHVPTSAPTAVPTESTPPPAAPPEPPPAPATASAPVEATPVAAAPQADAPPVDGNGTHNDTDGDVSMDLIRRHLEQRASRNQSELQVTPRPAPAVPTPPALDTTVDSDGEDDEPSQSGSSDSQTVGFPGLSDSDRRLIEEHMRRRAEASQDR